MAKVELNANRLEAFLVSWAAARARCCLPTLANRLATFLEQAGPHLTVHAISRREAPVTLIDRLRPETLEATLQILREPLIRARAAGAFLNVWSTARLKRNEVRNAAVLASLLDPHNCPETGPAFLWAFLQRVKWSGSGPVLGEAETLAGYMVRTEDCPLGCADNRVDLSIEGPDFLLLIEVKIDAFEGVDQLQRYDSVLQEKARLLGKRPVLVYLSPRPPQNPPSGTAYATWAEVVSAARQIGRKHKSGDRPLVSTLLLHFAAHVAQFA